MKNGCIIFLLLISFTAMAQTERSQTLPAIPYIRYSWIAPPEAGRKNISATTLFEGSAHDMEYLKMEAAKVTPAKNRTRLQVARDEEQIFLIKSGIMTITIGDSTWSIGPGSIALLMPGEQYSLQNDDDKELFFYRMTYRSKTPVDPARGESSGGSIVRDWNKLPFAAHSRGGVRRYFERPTAMCKRFEMHVTTLNAGLKSHEAHTHNAEEIVLVLEDENGSKSKTEMQIGDKFFQGEAGDLYYLGSNVLHGIKNVGSDTCSYFAFQFE